MPGQTVIQESGDTYSQKTHYSSSWNYGRDATAQFVVLQRMNNGNKPCDDFYIALMRFTISPFTKPTDPNPVEMPIKLRKRKSATSIKAWLKHIETLAEIYKISTE